MKNEAHIVSIDHGRYSFWFLSRQGLFPELSNYVFTGSSQAGPSMLHPAGAGHPVAYTFNVFAFATDNQHLKAIFVVKVYVGGGNDGIVMPML